MDISDSIFEDSHSNGGNNDVMMEPLGGNLLQYQLPDLPTFPEEFLDWTPRPHAMPVIDPFSVTESFINDAVVSEIEQDRPSALSAEEIVDGYLPTKDTADQFSKLHVLVCGYCHSVFHVVDEFNSHLRKCSGVKTNMYCGDLSISALALVLWSNTIHRKLKMKPSLTHLSSTDFLAYSIQQKWFRLSKKTKMVWETAARTLQQLGKDGKLVFPGELETRIRDAGSRSHSGSSGGRGWPETWRNPEEIGQEDEIQQEMIRLDCIKQEVIELDEVEETVVENEQSSILTVRTSSRVRDRKSSSSLPVHPVLENPDRNKDLSRKMDTHNASKREKWKETKRNSRGKWHKEKPVEAEDLILRCEKCAYQTKEEWKMNRHKETVKHKKLVAQDEVEQTNSSNQDTSLKLCEVREEEGQNSKELLHITENKLAVTKEVDNSTMNVTTPRCDISPVRQGLEESPMKKKKFKLFNHTNEQVTEGKKGVSLESSQRVLSPGIVDSDETNKPTESNKLDCNNSWETNKNESILERVTEHSVEEVSSISKGKSTESILEKVNEDSVLNVGSISSRESTEYILEKVTENSVNKEGSKSVVKPRAIRVDPVLKVMTGDRKPSKRKSAIAAKGKVSSWIQGHSLGSAENDQVVMKDSIKDKSKPLQIAQGKKSSTYKDMLFIKKDSTVQEAVQVTGKTKIENGKRKSVIESASQERGKSETVSLSHGKRKSAIAAQGKVSCWAHGQSLDDYLNESPTKKLKPNQTKTVPKTSLHMSNNEILNGVPYSSGITVKLNGKFLSPGLKMPDLPTINVQKVKIDESMLQKLQLERLEKEESEDDCSKQVEADTIDDYCNRLDETSSTTDNSKEDEIDSASYQSNQNKSESEADFTTQHETGTIADSKKVEANLVPDGSRIDSAGDCIKLGETDNAANYGKLNKTGPVADDGNINETDSILNHRKDSIAKSRDFRKQDEDDSHEGVVYDSIANYNQKETAQHETLNVASTPAEAVGYRTQFNKEPPNVLIENPVTDALKDVIPPLHAKYASIVEPGLSHPTPSTSSLNGKALETVAAESSVQHGGGSIAAVKEAPTCAGELKYSTFFKFHSSIPAGASSPIPHTKFNALDQRDAMVQDDALDQKVGTVQEDVDQRVATVHERARTVHDKRVTTVQDDALDQRVVTVHDERAGTVHAERVVIVQEEALDERVATVQGDALNQRVATVQEDALDQRVATVQEDAPDQRIAERAGTVQDETVATVEDRIVSTAQTDALNQKAVIKQTERVDIEQTDSSNDKASTIQAKRIATGKSERAATIQVEATTAQADQGERTASVQSDEYERSATIKAEASDDRTATAQAEAVHKGAATAQVEALDNKAATSQSEALNERAATAQAESLDERAATAQAEALDERAATAQAGAIYERAATVQIEALDDKAATSQVDTLNQTSALTQAEALVDRAAPVQTEALVDRAVPVQTKELTDKATHRRTEALADRAAPVQTEAFVDRAATSKADQSVCQELPISLKDKSKNNNSHSSRTTLLESSSIKPLNPGAQCSNSKPTVLGHRESSTEPRANVPSERFSQLAGQGVISVAQPVISSHQTIRFQPPILAKKSAPPREPGELPRASSILKDPHLRIKTRVPTTAQTVHNKYAYHEGIHLLKPEVIVPSKPVKTIVGTVRAKPVIVDETKSLTACLPKGYEMVKQKTGSKTEFCLIKKPHISANAEPVKYLQARRIVEKPKILQHQMKPNLTENETSSHVSPEPGESYLPTTSTSLQEHLRYPVAATFNKTSGNVQKELPSHSFGETNPDQSFEAVGDRLPLPSQSVKDEIGFLARQSYSNVERALPISQTKSKLSSYQQAGQNNKIQFIESAIPHTKSLASMPGFIKVTDANPKESFVSAGVIKSTQQPLKVQPLGSQQSTGRVTNKVVIQLPGGNKMLADLTDEQLKNLNITNMKEQVDNCSSVLVTGRDIQSPIHGRVGFISSNLSKMSQAASTPSGLVASTPSGHTSIIPPGPAARISPGQVLSMQAVQVASIPPGHTTSIPPGHTTSMPPGLVASMPPGLVASIPPGPATRISPGQVVSMQAVQVASIPPGHSTSIPPGHTTSIPPGHTTSMPPGRTTNIPPGSAASISRGQIVSMPAVHVATIPPSHTTSMPPGHTTSMPPGSAASISPGGTSSISPGSTGSIFPGQVAVMPPGRITSISPGSTGNMPVGQATSMPPVQVARKSSGPAAILPSGRVERPRRPQIVNIPPFQDGGVESATNMPTNPNQHLIKSQNISTPPYLEGEQILRQTTNIATSHNEHMLKPQNVGTTPYEEAEQSPNEPVYYGIQDPAYTEAPDLGQYSSHQLFESTMKEPPVEGSSYYQPASPKGKNKNMPLI